MESMKPFPGNAKRKLTTAAFVTAILFVASPSSPVASLVSDVGDAQAYAPCDHEYWIMQDAWAVYIQVGGAWAFLDFLAALQDYHHCMAG